MTTITELPEDILAIMFTYLDAKSFLRFCRTCKDVYQYHQDSAYWRTMTSSTFRLPISPLLKAEGARWYWLYKRLRTQTRLYTWGQGLKGNLGPGRSAPIRRAMRGPMIRPIVPHHTQPTAVTYQRIGSNWPTEAHVPAEVGVIADLQCGGWSTSILTSEGRLYTVGLIYSVDMRTVGEASDQFRRLEYLTQSTSAIQQFSSGRSHILALTDDGHILSWDRINAKGLKVFSRTGQDFGGKAIRVAAGWGESSAYVPETGIVYWKPVVNNQEDEMLDGIHVKERIIPGTARNLTAENTIVEVVKHIVLQEWIVWVTSDGKLYACDVRTNSQEQTQPTFPPFEVPGYSSDARVLKDVQGQYDKFAVFTDTGEVLAGHTDYLGRCSQRARESMTSNNDSTPLPPDQWPRLEQLLVARPSDNPALQHNQVISLAFGDHHYHALHSNGKVTTYGHEPQSCGALGLGDMPSGARFRSLRFTSPGFRADSRLIPQAERRGRQIWFEPEKRDWLMYMEDTMKRTLVGSVDAQGHRLSPEELWTDTRKQFMFSEWVEQEGRHWREGPTRGTNTDEAAGETSSDDKDFHLNPYFTLAISAAGWHSGALVLVDEDEAEETRQKWTTLLEHETHEDEHADQRTMPGHYEPEIKEPEEVFIWKTEGFPKVKLPDGFEMPGEGELRIWRDGVPTMSELGL